MAARTPFRRVAAAAGLDPDQILRHTLRHTAITHLVQAGVDLPTVKRISGHKTLAMVERYAHRNGTHIQAAMDKLQARFFWRDYTGATQATATKENGLEAEAANPLISFLNFGGLGRNRTTDTRIFKTTHTACHTTTNAKICNAFSAP